MVFVNSTLMASCLDSLAMAQGNWLVCIYQRDLSPVGYGLQLTKLTVLQYRYGNVNIQGLTSIYLAIVS